MTDFERLRDIFEMAEVLTSEDEDSLEILTANLSTNQAETIVFKFNTNEELTEVYIEN